MATIAVNKSAPSSPRFSSPPFVNTRDLAASVRPEAPILNSSPPPPPRPRPSSRARLHPNLAPAIRQARPAFLSLFVGWLRRPCPCVLEEFFDRIRYGLWPRLRHISTELPPPRSKFAAGLFQRVPSKSQPSPQPRRGEQLFSRPFASFPPLARSAPLPSAPPLLRRRRFLVHICYSPIYFATHRFSASDKEFWLLGLRCSSSRINISIFGCLERWHPAPVICLR